MSLLTIAGAVLVGAQEQEAEDFQPASNPYQEDVPYQIGEELTPNVEVSGVRWLGVRVAPRKEGEPAPDQDAEIAVDLRFDNRERKGVTVVVALLLEDAEGLQLHKLATPEMRIGGNRLKEFRHKLTAPGDALLGTRRMYLFFRVQ